MEDILMSALFPGLPPEFILLPWRKAIKDLSEEGDEWARSYVDDGSVDTLLRALVYLSDIRMGTLEEMLPRLECLKAILSHACGMEHLICCPAERSRLFMLMEGRS